MKRCSVVLIGLVSVFSINLVAADLQLSDQGQLQVVKDHKIYLSSPSEGFWSIGQGSQGLNK